VYSVYAAQKGHQRQDALLGLLAGLAFCWPGLLEPIKHKEMTAPASIEVEGAWAYASIEFCPQTGQNRGM
jgi:hypothetical protein